MGENAFQSCRGRGGVLYSHGNGLLEAGNETIQDEATLIHNEGELDTPCLEEG